VVLEVGSRRIRHWNVTDHPTADGQQQFRMVISGEEPHRFLIHDHDSIYSDRVDRTIAALGLTILKTPVRSPQNAFCERVIGTIRRELTRAGQATGIITRPALDTVSIPTDNIAGLILADQR
jgi:putative transposase